MNKEQDAFQETLKPEEDLLDFEFDELSEESGTQRIDGPAVTGEEDIIELTDVIEEGEPVADHGSDDTVRLDDLGAVSEGTSEAEDILGGDIEDILEEDVSGDLDLDLDSVLEPIGELEEEAPSETEKRSEIQGMVAPEVEGPLEMAEELEEMEPLPGAGEDILDEAEPETEADLTSEISLDFELDSGVEALSEEVVPSGETGIKIPDEDLSAMVPEPDQGLPAVTLEAMEAAVTKAVQDVLDRSVSQSIDSAAERVLSEKLGVMVPALIQEAVSGVMPDTVRSAVTETLSERLEALIPNALEDIVQRSMESTVAAVAERVISEKIEAILPDLAERAISRVAQETMLSVAERVIAEEIASLRKALEPA